MSNFGTEWLVAFIAISKSTNVDNVFLDSDTPDTMDKEHDNGGPNAYFAVRRHAISATLAFAGRLTWQGTHRQRLQPPVQT